MNIHIIEMPLDFGASRHGSDMGPSAIRLAGLRTKLESLGHTLVTYNSLMHIQPQEYEEVGNPKAKYSDPITKVCVGLAKEVEAACDADEFPLVLGGDHSIALGSLAGVSAFAKKNHKKLVWLWFTRIDKLVF